MESAVSSMHSTRRQCLGWWSSWELQQKGGVPRRLMQAPTMLGRMHSSGQCSSAPRAVQRAFSGTRGPVLVDKLPLIIIGVWLHALHTGTAAQHCSTFLLAASGVAPSLTRRACVRAAVLRTPWLQSR